MRRLRRAYQRNARQEAKRRKKFKKRAIAAGTAAVITLGAGAGINKALAAYTPDNHELPVSQDADADLLANKEELAIGYRVFEPDQNRNEVPDGVELAKRCAADINELPIYDPYSGDPEPDEIYKICAYAYGIYICPICGETIVMVFTRIVNPKLGLAYPDNWPYSDSLSALSLHFMEHGSFSLFEEADDLRFDFREDIPSLLRVLELRFPYDPNEHQLPLDYVVESVGQLAPDANDLDGDLLADSEELKAGFNLYDPDQDQDLTPDGIELAKRCAAVINQLPWPNEVTDPNETYKWGGAQLGLEACDICGELMGMGPGGIVNPRLGINVECNIYMAIHYMEHGSFSYSGDAGAGRIDVPALMKVLEMPQRCGDLGTLYLPGDLNKDCKVDFTDFVELADKWLESTDPNQDGDTER